MKKLKTISVRPLPEIRYFMGRKVEGSWEAFSTAECKDAMCMVNLPALAVKHGYAAADGEYGTLIEAQMEAELRNKK